MLDRVSVPLLPSLRARILRGGCRPIGLAIAIALAASASLIATSAGEVYAADPVAGTTPSIQYQEALAHSAKTYSFAPGSPVTVPFRPRAGDSAMVDGAAPVALPAAQGSNAVAPNLTAPSIVTPNSTLTALRREVFGFLPYWELGSTLNYDTLSTIAYFGVDLNGDGTLSKSSNGWNGWNSSAMTSLISDAHSHGTRVVLSVESFAWDSGGAATQSAVLGNPTVNQAAAQAIAAEVGRRGADGVNLDFEPIASLQVANFVAFTRLVRAELDKVHPGYELTFCATGAPSTYDLPNLLAPGAADAVFIMGYDLRGGTPAYAGSIDPLTSTLTHYSLTSVVNTFISQVPASKVILGLPWYGHAWSTGTTNAVYAPTANMTKYGLPASGITYSDALGIAAAHLTDATPGNGLQYDTAEQTAWTAYYGTFGGTSPTWRELYFDNARALSAKIDAIDGWNLRGLGIWALGYDNNNGNGDLTAVVAAKLQTSVAPTTYHALTPSRILDTRSGMGLSGSLSSHVARTFQVTGQGNVPTNATAVTGNLTATGPSSLGYLYIGPFASNDPTSSTLNFSLGDDRANGVTVALGGTGTLSVTYAASTLGPTAQVIFDVTGYFTPDMSGATYHALTPARILDSRDGYWIGLAGAFSSHVARTFGVAGRGGVPSNATAVTGNLTVTQQTSLGYLYMGPSAMNNPTSSTLNFPLGDDRANGVTVALGAGGTLSVTYVAVPGATAQVVLDVTGYFTADTSGARYVPLAPTRLLDSRDGYWIGLAGASSSHVARTFTVSGHGGVPSNATAVTGNLTVTGQTSLGYLYVGPNAMNNPTSSTLNFPLGDDRANAVTVALGAGGTLSVTYVAVPGATAQVVFDVTGYFTPDTSGATYHALTPARVLDSRDGTGLSGSFGSNVARTFGVAGRGGVPTNATAVTGNLTVTQQTSLGYLYMGPVATNNPTSSTINFPLADDRANGVTVALGAGGTLSVTYVAVPGASAQVIFDVTGYFTPDSTGATYHALTPARVLDSRDGYWLGLAGASSSHVARTFGVIGHGGVSSNAIAVTGNLTVTGQTALGYLYVGPNATNNPTSSTLNFPLGDDRANSVTVALCGGGTLSVTYVAVPGATAQVIFDVTGYFVK